VFEFPISAVSGKKAVLSVRAAAFHPHSFVHFRFTFISILTHTSPIGYSYFELLKKIDMLHIVLEKAFFNIVSRFFLNSGSVAKNLKNGPSERRKFFFLK
jgi:hypothetical protein